MLVAQSGINDTVTDSLGDDLLGLSVVLKGQLLLDIPKGNLAVRNVDFLETEFDHSMLQSVHQRQVLVLLEEFPVSILQLSELVHISLFDTVDNLEVGSQRLLIILLVEDRASRDLSHQEVNDDEELLHLDSEANSTNLGALSESLDQRCLRFGVLQLHSLNSSNIVQVTSILVV